MLKYMLTTKCNKKCPYCITRNVKAKECHDVGQITQVLESFSKVFKDIMLTGGEPSKAIAFIPIVNLAYTLFKNVYITTKNPAVLGFSGFKAITLSLHDPTISPRTTTTRPVYAAIMADEYTQRLPEALREKGYSGLTINEDQRPSTYTATSPPFIDLIPDTWKLKHANFSIRINRKGKCMDETIILPDLKVIHNFRPYL